MSEERLEEFVYFVKFTSIVFGSSMSLFLFALALYHFGVFRRLMPGSQFTMIEATMPQRDALNTNPLLQADNKVVAEEPKNRAQTSDEKTANENEEKTVEINMTQEESSGTQLDSSEDPKSQTTQLSVALPKKTMHTAVEFVQPISDAIKEELHCVTARDNSVGKKKKKDK